MKNEPCPPENALSEFVRCHVSEDQAESISEHIANCERCEETVVGLEQNADTTLGILKDAPAAFPFQNEPELKKVVLAVKQRPHEPPSKTSEQLPIPQLEQLRDYRIVEKIGEGGMGAVYRAIHTRLNKTVALKVLSNSRLRDESAVSRFQREMSIVGRLQHPNIVQAHDAGEEAGQHFLVMEYVDGTDLSDILRQCGPLPISAACEVIAQAAVGLQYAHENGLVHRDIKPSNLMLALSNDQKSQLGPAVVVKILDLGLARLQTDEKEHGPELTVDGQVMGTLDYMAPEQGGDSHSVDIRADIYSLGATLYKLLTGEVLFHDERHRSVIQKLTALATETAPSVQVSRPDVPQSLAGVIARMLAKRPQDRFATPGEVVSALQPYRSAAGLPALLGVPDLITEEVLEGSTVLVSPENQPPRRRFPLAKAVKWLCGAAMLLAAVIVITTKEGTVEIESPDGKLPEDIKVSITRNGDTDVILQKDNDWQVSVAGGKFQLLLKGGTDRFELVDDTLTVSRFGKNIVKLRKIPAPPIVAKVENAKPEPVKPAPAKPDSTQPEKVASQPSAPPKVPRVVREKPFIVTRKGQSTGEYSSLYGALSAVSGNDVIEVHSNGPVMLRTPEPISKRLHLRAGKGYRPLLVVKQVIVMQAGLVIEDCDVDQRVAHFGMNGGRSPDPWEFRRCRFWGFGFNYFNAPQLLVEDCIFDTEIGFMMVPTEPIEVTVTNCVISTSRIFLSVEGDRAVPVKIDLKANTYRFSTAGSLLYIPPTAKPTVTVEAAGNVFDFSFGGTVAGMMPGPQWRGQIDWRGQDNVFDGDWYRELTKDGAITAGLETWNKLWKQPEQNSTVLKSLQFDGARTGDWAVPERIAGIRVAVEQIKTDHQLQKLGPDWNLIGVGDSYVRALEVLGRAVPKDRLRPEVHPDGPIVIFRKDVEFKGFLTLNAALEAAETGDVIEIRTDDPIPGVLADGKSRRLTLRAAPGYSPIINSDFALSEDRLIVEGLTFRGALGNSGIPPWAWRGEGPVFPGKGSFERLTNCVFLGSDVLHTWGWFGNEGDRAPEITNCVLGMVAAGLKGGKKLHIQNSVLADAWISVEGTKEQEPGHLEITDSVLWTPDAGVVPHAFSIHMRSPLTIASRNSVFASPGSLVEADDVTKHLRGWTGIQNVYIRPGAQFMTGPHGTGCTNTLDEVQQSLKTDADSIELLPLSFDAGNWRIWRERSTDYKPLKKDLDFGADIDRLSRAITSSVTVKKSK